MLPTAYITVYWFRGTRNTFICNVCGFGLIIQTSCTYTCIYHIRLFRNSQPGFKILKYFTCTWNVSYFIYRAAASHFEQNRLCRNKWEIRYYTLIIDFRMEESKQGTPQVSSSRSSLWEYNSWGFLRRPCQVRIRNSIVFSASTTLSNHGIKVVAGKVTSKL